MYWAIPGALSAGALVAERDVCFSVGLMSFSRWRKLPLSACGVLVAVVGDRSIVGPGALVDGGYVLSIVGSSDFSRWDGRSPDLLRLQCSFVVCTLLPADCEILISAIIGGVIGGVLRVQFCGAQFLNSIGS